MSDEVIVTSAENVQCPECKTKIKVLSGPRAPEAGAMVVCGNCSALMVLNEDLRARRPTPREAYDAENDLEVRFAIQIIKGRAHGRKMLNRKNN